MSNQFRHHWKSTSNVPLRALEAITFALIVAKFWVKSGHWRTRNHKYNFGQCEKIHKASNSNPTRATALNPTMVEKTPSMIPKSDPWFPSGQRASKLKRQHMNNHENENDEVNGLLLKSNPKRKSTFGWKWNESKFPKDDMFWKIHNYRSNSIR